MIIQWIEKKLKQRVARTKHNVVKLSWQKAELQRKIAEAKGKKAEINTSIHTTN